MGQQSDNLLRQMRDNSDTERRNRSAYQSQLERNQGIEAQNRSENRQFQRASDRLYFEAQANNLKTKADNYLIRSQQDEKTFAALAAFSGTMGKLVVGWQQKKAEEEKKQGYRDVMLNGPDPKKQVAVQSGVQELSRANSVIQTVADNLQDNGAPPEVVHQTRKLSKSYQVGMAMARADLASMKLDGWLADKYRTDNETQISFNGQVITPAKHIGPDQRAAITDVLIKQFVAENGLLDIDPELVAPALLKMRQVEQKHLDKERDNYIKAENENSRNQINAQFDTGIVTDPIRAWNFSLEEYAHLSDENGTRLGYKGAREALLQRMVDQGVSVETLDQIANSPTPFQPNKTWGGPGGLFEGEFKKARRSILTQEVQDEDLRDRMENQEFENWSDNVLQELYKGNASEEIVKNAITQSEEIWGRVDGRLKDYMQNNTLQARTKEEQEKMLLDLWSREELTVDMLKSGAFLPAVRADWIGRAQEQDKQRAPEVQAARKPAEEAITNELRRVSNLVDTDKTPHWSFSLAKAHAERQLTAKAKVYMQSGKPPEEAYSLAAQDIVKEIQSNNGNDPSKRVGTYSTSTSGDGSFKRWAMSGSGGAGGMSKARDNVSSIRSQVQNGGAAAVTERKLISEAEARSLVNPDAPIPPIISVIQNSLPAGKEMSEFDIIDAQLNMFGLPQRQRPLIQQQVDSVMSPELNRLLYKTPTRRRTDRALTGAGISASASDGTPIGPGPERQAIARIASTLGVDIKDVVTFINYETAGQLLSGANRRGLDTWGGSGGQYLGWIQFSPHNQQQYGVRPGMTPDQMATAVIKYLKNSGVRPGDRLEHLYQAIQAPAYLSEMRKTGKNIGRDSNDSVANHVAKMRQSHGEAAYGWLRQGAGAGGQATSSMWRSPELLSAPAKRLLSQHPLTSSFMQQESFRSKPHEGNDYGTPVGTKLSFKQPGTVLQVGDPSKDNGGYGGFVDVRLADGNVVRIGHLSRVNVKPGQRIRAKQVAALTGNTGRSTGPHAHLEHLSGPTGTQETTKGKRNPSWVATQIYADI
jgi:murein DD-endopeptidase MepM/ murein hydrolase activator NlpD